MARSVNDFINIDRDFRAFPLHPMSGGAAGNVCSRFQPATKMSAAIPIFPNRALPFALERPRH